MREPRPIRGARTPLFERLTDLDPENTSEPEPARVLNRAALRESVRRELSWLLNTRSPMNSARTGTILDYGIPGFTWLSPASGQDRELVGEAIATKVAAFEPRLRDVRVSMEANPANPRAIVGRLEAMLVVEMIAEPVSFPLSISSTGSAEVASPEAPSNGS